MRVVLDTNILISALMTQQEIRPPSIAPGRRDTSPS